MANWQILSDNFRLTPWSLEEHAGYVLQEYGKLLSRPDAAQAYVDGYKDAETKFEQAYANQQEFLNRTTGAVGAAPQLLPPLQRIDWDPVKRLAAITAANQAPVETVVTPAPELPPVEVVAPPIESVVVPPAGEAPVDTVVEAPADTPPVDVPVSPDVVADVPAVDTPVETEDAPKKEKKADNAAVVVPPVTELTDAAVS